MHTSVHHQETVAEITPQYLFKILSLQNWHESQKGASLKLSAADAEFIHFSKEEQLNRIMTKYWGQVAEFVVLKIETAKLPGNLVFETNPGGTDKYYHLYYGSIPLDAVADAKIIQQVNKT